MPRIMPLPVRVVVILTILLPVFKVPLVILIVPAFTLFCRPTSITPEALLMVSVPKVVAPVIKDGRLPANAMVPAPGVKFPWLIQLPFTVWVKLPALKVVLVAIVIWPLAVMAALAVFVLPLERVR